MPGGKNQSSFSFTSATKLLPSMSMQVIRAVPYSMKAHSAAVCQCSSRTPPAVSRISTPARLFETASSRAVTSRDHPPSCKRLCANANGYLNVCTPPASVQGGLNESGFAASSPEFAGPGSLLLFSETEFGASFCCAKTPSAESTLAAANAAELTPRNPRRDKASFWTSSPMPPPFGIENDSAIRLEAPHGAELYNAGIARKVKLQKNREVSAGEGLQTLPSSAWRQCQSAECPNVWPRPLIGKPEE